MVLLVTCVASMSVAQAQQTARRGDDSLTVTQPMAKTQDADYGQQYEKAMIKQDSLTKCRDSLENEQKRLQKSFKSFQEQQQQCCKECQKLSDELQKDKKLSENKKHKEELLQRQKQLGVFISNNEHKLQQLDSICKVEKYRTTTLRKHIDALYAIRDTMVTRILQEGNPYLKRSLRTMELSQLEHLREQAVQHRSDKRMGNFIARVDTAKRAKGLYDRMHQALDTRYDSVAVNQLLNVSMTPETNDQQREIDDVRDSLRGYADGIVAFREWIQLARAPQLQLKREDDYNDEKKQILSKGNNLETRIERIPYLAQQYLNFWKVFETEYPVWSSEHPESKLADFRTSIEQEIMK
jgi:superfamily II DNA helicase RecQ